MDPDDGAASRARIVVIGGGVAGASIAYHLAMAGETDVVVVERAELTSGSTFHSAGMVGQLRSDPTLTRMNMHSVRLYRELERGDHPVGWVESGSIRVASSSQRWTELLRQLAWAKLYDLPMEPLTPRAAKALFPLMSLDGVVGGVYLPTDGFLDPSQLCYSLAAGARARGVRIQQRTRVLGIDVVNGRAVGVRTDRGSIECEVVVNAGGMFAAEIGRLAGVRIPLLPMSHQYLVTEEVAGLPVGLPSLRDPDLLVYFRPEGRGLLMGGYERTARAFAAGSAQVDAIPADFNGKLLPQDWERFEEIAANSTTRVPAMAEVGVRRIINGPEAFTPDNEFCLGETEIDGLFVAAGFCAHGIAAAGGVGQLMAEWILTGRPPMNVWHMDINRFGPQYRSPEYTYARTVENYQTYYDIPYPGRERSSGRPLRVSPLYDWHASREAVFGEKNGWERVNFYASNVAASTVAASNVAASNVAASNVAASTVAASNVAASAVPASTATLGPELARPVGWAARLFDPAVAVEHLACRATAALFDETSFAKLQVSGVAAEPFLQWVCDNDVSGPVGTVTYTQALNAGGGIEADVTVTRIGPSEFRVITGTAFGSHDAAWLRRQARASRFEVQVDDITDQLCCFALWGPLSREILAPLTAADLGNAAFPFMSAQPITVAGVAVLAQRVTFVGELGWELYCAVEHGAELWSAVWAAGTPVGMVAGGYRAVESLRLEKGYRVWSTDITPETTPLEAGLGFCVAWDKPGGFLGRDALVAARAAGLTRRLCCLTVDDPTVVLLGGEPVRCEGEVVGRVTSAGFGFTVRQSIAYAYLPVAFAKPGTAVSVDSFGQWVTGEVRRSPLHDPAGVAVHR